MYQNINELILGIYNEYDNIKTTLLCYNILIIVSILSICLYKRKLIKCVKIIYENKFEIILNLGLFLYGLQFLSLILSLLYFCLLLGVIVSKYW